MARKYDRKQVLARCKVWFLLGKSLTPKQCQDKFDGWRLSDVVYRLKKYGLKFVEPTPIVRLKNGSSYAKYSLIKHKQK